MSMARVCVRRSPWFAAQVKILPLWSQWRAWFRPPVSAQPPFLFQQSVRVQRRISHVRLFPQPKAWYPVSFRQLLSESTIEAQMRQDLVAECCWAPQRTRPWNRRSMAVPHVWSFGLELASRPVWPLERIAVSAGRNPQPALRAPDPPISSCLPPPRSWARAEISERWFPAGPFCALSLTSLEVSISPYWNTLWVTLSRANVTVVVALPKQKY